MDRECPQCGAVQSTSDKFCGYCKAEIVVSNLACLNRSNSDGIKKYLKYYKNKVRRIPDDDEGLLGLGLCYLEMGTYTLAQKCFEQIIERSPEVSPAYYYYSLSNIAGRRLMTMTLEVVRKIEEYLNTAIQLDSDQAHYKLLLAMLKGDYYEANGMKVNCPSAAELLSDISSNHIVEEEVVRLLATVKVANTDHYLHIMRLEKSRQESIEA